MIFEHEIPSGSRLYFGKSAKLKRVIEHIAGQTLESLGFEEIVTPIFSYHQHESFSNLKPLIRLNDAANHPVTLRADSTVDVVRIVTKRLGRSMESKKWFYIQPILTFPTTELYQVGAEVIEGNFVEAANTTIDIVKKLDLKPTLQIANIRIPHLLNAKYGISLELLMRTNLEQILQNEHPWMERLVKINSIQELQNLSMFPEDIVAELEEIRKAVEQIEYENIIISPLYYAKMRYYKSLTFRMIDGNMLLANGGIYRIDEKESAGFALYIDDCIACKMSQEEEC